MKVEPSYQCAAGKQAASGAPELETSEAEEERVTVQQIRSYAHHVENRDVYISLLDLALLADSEGKDAVIIFHTSEGPMSFQKLLKVMETACGVDNLADDDLPDFASQDTWFYVGCMANFQKKPINHLNHFIPCWHKEQFSSEAEWDVVRHSLLQDLTGQHLEIANRLHEIMEEEEEAELIEAEMETMMHEEQCVKDTIKAVEEMLSMGLYPFLVPADGNCGVWSTLMLRRGLPARMDEKKDLQEMMALRKDLVDLWQGAADHPEWQHAFKVFQLHTIATDISNSEKQSAPASRAQGGGKDQTPPRKQRRAPDLSPAKHVDAKRCRRADFGKPQEKQYLMARAHAPVIQPKQQEPEAKDAAQSNRDMPDADMEIVDDGGVTGGERLLNPLKIVRARHGRTWKRAPVNEGQVKMKTVKAYLAHCKLTYAAFQSHHSRTEHGEGEAFTKWYILILEHTKCFGILFCKSCLTHIPSK